MLLCQLYVIKVAKSAQIPWTYFLKAAVLSVDERLQLFKQTGFVQIKFIMLCKYLVFGTCVTCRISATNDFWFLLTTSFIGSVTVSESI